jgi:hypothetical protein
VGVLLKVNKASKNVFADDYAKLQQYLRPDEPDYTPKEEEPPAQNQTTPAAS